MCEFEDSEQRFYELLAACLGFYNNIIDVFSNSCLKNIELVTLESVQAALISVPPQEDEEPNAADIDSEFPIPELSFDINEFIDAKDLHKE